ncbi:para-aminobenzoate synthetase component 1 [Pontibacter ummariensis]|uniref:Para-aminobenzoate synthetase component 1 n=1 Tax=Pontibacter ummariensis TaxID=1610492 RepID=A0A239BMU8_9BACT|nr:anthranilate synthase component I family protein [Pontibacter ummariensis]PRY15718.1 para-aminobenzoate synthetase component 1 [Pontibacter ummariensis]SNS09475.1 para-aminobenzoate synthetase component 1 [Pontibacter ummariensis]
MFTHTITAKELPIPLDEFRLKALAWANQYPHVAYYSPGHATYPHGGFAHLLAVSSGSIPLDEAHAFDSLRHLLQQRQGLLCGFLTYDLKNQVERLSSQHPDKLGFPSVHFFSPEVFFYFKENSISICTPAAHAKDALAAILAVPTPQPASPKKVQIRQRVSKEKYLHDVAQMRKRIREGDVYELNYCIEFYADNVQVAPLPLYLALHQASPTPFSGYFKLHDKYLLCASPERFLKKEGNKLISQPIKGTIRRGVTPEEDERLRQQLRHDEKELAENMMIVDLVRNDLSRSCAIGTVQVEEMFGIYGFRQVWQMISTISGKLRPEMDLVDALQGAFPMGSMTGAPKISAMQLIEELESTKRGLYSGTIGYIKPNGDCDFNVVIRSIQYNASEGYLSFMVGSAITYDADPEKEYEECLLKAQAMLKVLNQAW